MTWASVASATASQPLRLSSPVRKQEEQRKRIDPKKLYANACAARLIHDLYSLSDQEANYLRSNNTLDLHMMFPDEASAKVRSNLQSWWSEEMQCRELSCGRMNGHQAVNVGSFTIITGSGKHSKNGICVMKKVTRKILDQGRYLYRETPARFEVFGKKL